MWSGLDLLESVLDIVRQTALGLDRLQLARVRFTSHLHLLVDPAPFNTLHFSVSMCSNLEPPQNGNIVTTSTQFGGKATYSCTEGYQLEGDEVRTCQANGFWSGSAPFCSSKPITCTKPSIEPSLPFVTILSCELWFSGSSEGRSC